MKFDPKYLYLITSVICTIHVLYTLYSGEEFNPIFYIASMWIVLGIGLYIMAGQSEKK